MIAVDVMGGDRAPQAPVLGALRAARRGIAVTLYGDKPRIEALLNQYYRQWHKLSIQIEHCSQAIDMHEKPAKTVLQKEDSSLVRAVKAVADRKARAIVSAGNSGAMLIAGSLILGRASGVQRPAIGQFLPTKKSSIFCLDLGANVDCKPEYLEQFGIIGSTYVRMVKKIERPRVALLSNGQEEYKGCASVRQAYLLLKNAPIHFVGNLEPREMFDDHADVLVSDGFVGNVMLKAIEGTTQAVGHWIKEDGSSSWWRRILFLFSIPMLQRLRSKSDYARKGGALLLGINHPMIFAHGSSDARAIMYAIELAHHTVKSDFVPRFNKELTYELQKNVKGARRVAQKVRSIFRH